MKFDSHLIIKFKLRLKYYSSSYQMILKQFDKKMTEATVMRQKVLVSNSSQQCPPSLTSFPQHHSLTLMCLYLQISCQSRVIWVIFFSKELTKTYTNHFITAFRLRRPSFFNNIVFYHGTLASHCPPFWKGRIFRHLS